MHLAKFSNVTAQVPEISQFLFFSSHSNNALLTNAAARKQIQKAELAEDLKMKPGCCKAHVQLRYNLISTQHYINAHS